MYLDRHEAGQKLAQELKNYKDKKETIVMAIPRGGVVVGYEIAKALNLPLDIVVIKKIGAPGNPEYAIGAMDADGEIALDKSAVLMTGATEEYLEKEKETLSKEIQRRLKEYRGTDKYNLKNKTIILVDDGIATGFTTQVAIRFLKKQKPKEIILAVPVAPPESIKELEKEADEVICPLKPLFLGAVGAFYEVFDQTGDEEVKKYLKEINEIKNSP